MKQFRPGYASQALVVAPTRGRGLKHWLTNDEVDQARVAPTRGRGLKPAQGRHGI